MRQVALEEARQILPQEMATMLPRDSLLEVAGMCGAAPESTPEQLAGSLAAELADVVWSPPAGCVPSLRRAGLADVRARLQLFWRCAVALCAMPLEQLRALTARKRAFLHDLDAHLPPGERAAAEPGDAASPAAARLAHLRLNLPLFAMVAGFPERGVPASQGATTAGRAPPVPEAEEESESVSAPEGAPDAADAGGLEADGSEPRGAPAAGPAEPGAEGAGGAGGADKQLSAAKHTYDVGYQRWERFDVDEALREADGPAAPRAEAARLPARAPPSVDVDSPLEALDRAIAEAGVEAPRERAGGEDAEPGAAGSERPLGCGDVVEVSGLESESGRSLNGKRGTIVGYVEESARFSVKFASGGAQRVVCIKPARLTKVPCSDGAAADEACGTPEQRTAAEEGLGGDNCGLQSEEQASAETCQVATIQTDGAAEANTAEALTQEYRKWEAYDDMDDVDGDDSGAEDAGGEADLDALTGPAEEVSQIRAHWKRESRRQLRADAKQLPRADPAPKRPTQPELPQGPVIERPCEYRPQSDPQAASAKALRREYGKWRNFDADAALLELDNEGTSQEGNAMRCSAGKASAMLSAEGYTKDREEYDLDQDIEKQVGSLKKVLAQRLQDAAGFKAEGNALLRGERLEDARRAYRCGLEALELCQRAAVLMADSMQSRQARLGGDLHRNLAAVQLRLGDHEGARESCDRALECTREAPDAEGDEKARYRRALALLRLGRGAEARRDVSALAAARGEGDASVRRLRAEAAAAPG